MKRKIGYISKCYYKNNVFDPTVPVKVNVFSLSSSFVKFREKPPFLLDPEVGSTIVLRNACNYPPIDTELHPTVFET
jgi:hypothetical protein